VDAIRLSDYFNRPVIIERGTNLDHFVRGLATQPQHAPDRFFTAEVLFYKAIMLKKIKKSKIWNCFKNSSLRAIYNKIWKLKDNIAKNMPPFLGMS
jgi:hypothetical protein